MKSLSSKWCLPLALFVLLGAQGGVSAAEAPNSYKLDMKVKVGEFAPGDQKLEVAFGAPAQITVANRETLKGYRVQTTAKPAGPHPVTGEPAVQLDFVVLANTAGAWEVVGKPQIITAEGTRAKVSVSGARGFTLEVTATPQFLSSAVNFKPKTCDLTAPVLSEAKWSSINGDGGGDTGGPAPCCQRDCVDPPPPEFMECCGAAAVCCTCGVCCVAPLG